MTKPKTWNVPVNGVSKEIKEIPEKDCELCAKCKEQLGADQYRGRKKVKKRMEGLGSDGKPSVTIRRVSESFYYCSPECLEAHGAVDEGNFSF